MPILCRNCEREIDFNEKNYSIDGEIHCPKCVKERLITVYEVNGDYWEEEDVDYYYDKDDYIEEIERRVRALEEKNKKIELKGYELEELEDFKNELDELYE